MVNPGDRQSARGRHELQAELSAVRAPIRLLQNPGCATPLMASTLRVAEGAQVIAANLRFDTVELLLAHFCDSLTLKVQVGLKSQ